MMQDDSQVEGAVSLWVGVAASQSALEAYVDIDYSSADPERHSQFADDFGIEYFDEDFLERDFLPVPTRMLSDLLHGCSYDEVIIPKFVQLCGGLLPEEANALVLLYNHRHSGRVGNSIVASGPVKLRFMGSITVEMPWPD